MESQENIQELQLLEQNMQNILFQKQAFQMEVVENESALNEIEKAGDDVFKIIGQLMIKSDKEKIKKELDEKQQLLNLRLKSLEKQESEFKEQLESLRKEVIDTKK
ncbi:prefoldin subunit beta [archaeon]|jgi:prefoldin beta subunit|nr:prefoldin subunit beta [archaeon]MBT4373222.1 prefoldin subunit beta [archaeon]MBT4531567.1 prefoldin subunit beta [archaeon]MBT7001255.1 prefoldin subunit beta [archaeon]MBT7282259.1 prefoldin subunit beta [archaeon]